MHRQTERTGNVIAVFLGGQIFGIIQAWWMYQAGYDIEVIKRHGRWTSNVVHVYLWEGTGHSGLAAKMAAVDFIIHAQMPKKPG